MLENYIYSIIVILLFFHGLRVDNFYLDLDERIKYVVPIQKDTNILLH